MYNELFSIGPITIHGYGLMIGIGFIAALFIGLHRAKKKGLDGDFLFSAAIVCLIFGMLGAKLLYILTVLDKIIANPSDFLSLSSGFVVYGGIIVGILAGFVYCKIKGKFFRTYFDLVMPSISIAQGFGRLGCFFAGCCYGKETDSWCGITFNNSDFAPNGVSLIPTQLISSAGNFLIAGALIFIARKQRKPGLIAGLYLVFYGVGRFLVEMLRGDIERGSIGNLSTSQFISIFIVLIGIIYIIYVLKFASVPANLENGSDDKSSTILENIAIDVFANHEETTSIANESAETTENAETIEASENAETESVEVKQAEELNCDEAEVTDESTEASQPE